MRKILTGFLAVCFTQGMAFFVLYCIAYVQAIFWGVKGTNVLFNATVHNGLYIPSSFVACWVVCGHPKASGGGLTCSIASLWFLANYLLATHVFELIWREENLVISLLFFLTTLMTAFYGGDLGRRSRERTQRLLMQQEDAGETG